MFEKIPDHVDFAIVKNYRLYLLKIVNYIFNKGLLK